MADSKDSKEKKKKNKDSSPDEKKTYTPANTKTIPIMITLAAAFIACLISILQHVELKVYVERLLFSVIVFGIIGIIVRVILDRFFFREKDYLEAIDEKASKEDEEDSEKDDEEDSDEA